MVESRSIKVLGIDPGTTRLGFAVAEGTAQEIRLIASGVLGNAKSAKSGRLKEIHDGLRELISAHAPDVLALEKLFFSKNVKTAFEVAEARGVILLTAEIADRRVYECSPQEVKVALTGQGNATKQQVAAMAKQILKLHALPRLDDESDAMAIAITGIIMTGAGKGR